MTILTFLLTSSCTALSLASDFLMRFLSSSIWRLCSKICWKCSFTQSTVISLKIQIQTTWLTLSFSVASSSIISGIPHVIAAHLSSVRATVLSASFNSTHRSSSSLFSCFSSSLTGKHRCFEVLYMQGPWNDWIDVIIEQMTVILTVYLSADSPASTVNPPVMFFHYWCPPPVSVPQSEAAGDHSESLSELYQPE